MSCTCVHTGANRRPAYSNCQKVWPCAPESVLRKARLLLSTLRRHCYAYPWKTDGGLFLACAKYHPATDGKASSRLIQSRIDAGAPAVSVAIDFWQGMAMHLVPNVPKRLVCVPSATPCFAQTRNCRAPLRLCKHAARGLGSTRIAFAQE